MHPFKSFSCVRKLEVSARKKISSIWPSFNQLLGSCFILFHPFLDIGISRFCCQLSPLELICASQYLVHVDPFGTPKSLFSFETGMNLWPKQPPHDFQLVSCGVKISKYTSSYTLSYSLPQPFLFCWKPARFG